MLTPAQLQAGREWLAECDWRDCDADYILEEASDRDVVAAVARYFDGGWAGFLRDHCPAPVEGVALADARSMVIECGLTLAGGAL